MDEILTAENEVESQEHQVRHPWFSGPAADLTRAPEATLFAHLPVSLTC
jgi:hypothetical protein